MERASLPARALSIADRTLLAAVAAWGGGNGKRLWDRFSPGWRERLINAPHHRIDAVAARKGLNRVHAATARSSPKRIHPSWYVRALQEESPAVRRAVAAHAPDAIAPALTVGLDLSPRDLTPDRPPHPRVLRWAQSLWTERLVGGPPASPTDEPVVAVFGGLENAETRDRFAAILGLAKWGYALAAPGLPGDFESRHTLDEVDRAWLDQFQNLWGEADPRLAHVAHLDLTAAEAAAPFLPRLGLVTVARLLSVVEPTRARWLLQHLPYDAAKLARTRMNLAHATIPRRVLLEWEGKIFQAADDRFRLESQKSGEPR
jgi:hypothetical protein